MGIMSDPVASALKSAETNRLVPLEPVDGDNVEHCLSIDSRVRGTNQTTKLIDLICAVPEGHILKQISAKMTAFDTTAMILRIRRPGIGDMFQELRRHLFGIGIEFDGKLGPIDASLSDLHPTMPDSTSPHWLWYLANNLLVDRAHYRRGLSKENQDVLALKLEGLGRLVAEINRRSLPRREYHYNSALDGEKGGTTLLHINRIIDRGAMLYLGQPLSPEAADREKFLGRLYGYAPPTAIYRPVSVRNHESYLIPEGIGHAVVGGIDAYVVTPPNQTAHVLGILGGPSVLFGREMDEKEKGQWKCREGDTVANGASVEVLRMMPPDKPFSHDIEIGENAALVVAMGGEIAVRLANDTSTRISIPQHGAAILLPHSAFRMNAASNTAFNAMLVKPIVK
jgi:hypothetical protein